jgi:hypothetical protein
MRSLKYVGGAALTLLLSTPMSAHFHHMNMYKDKVRESNPSPIISKSFYLHIHRQDACRELSKKVAPVPTTPPLELCPKILALPFSTEPFKEAARFIENDEFANPVEESQPTNTVDDTAYISVKSRIEYWSKMSLSPTPIMPYGDIKTHTRVPSESLKMRIEFWSKKGSTQLAPTHSIKTITVGGDAASNYLSTPVEPHSKVISPITAPAKTLEAIISEDAKELAMEMARILRTGVTTTEGDLIFAQVDTRCRPKDRLAPEMIKAAMFRRAFLQWSQEHLLQLYTERGKRWRIEYPHLDNLFLN